MDLNIFNTLTKEEALSHLLSCCGSTTWASSIEKRRPFADVQSLITTAEKSWYGSTTESDWLEAFAHHPQIGNLESLKEMYRGNAATAAMEQNSVKQATEQTLQELAALNEQYKVANGFIFIVFATGKSAPEMVNLLKRRLLNTRSNELLIAMGEQYKILLLRLKKLFPNTDWNWMKPGQLTTHILDTASGTPAANMYVKLAIKLETESRSITEGFTNMDGRIPDFLPQGRRLQQGVYQLDFDTAGYYDSSSIIGFYPYVQITFEISDDTHYHVPLLISPFGYSTYRGS